jgi:hypothetical protein
LVLTEVGDDAVGVILEPGGETEDGVEASGSGAFLGLVAFEDVEGFEVVEGSLGGRLGESEVGGDFTGAAVGFVGEGEETVGLAGP